MSARCWVGQGDARRQRMRANGGKRWDAKLSGDQHCGEERRSYGKKALCMIYRFFFSSRRRHTRCLSDWSSDVCSSDLVVRYDHLAQRWPPSATPDTARQESACLLRIPAKCEEVDVRKRNGELDSCRSPFEIGRASCRERV